MSGLVLLALGNGVLIGVGRVLNGRMARHSSAAWATFVNHLVGFMSLSPLLLIWGSAPLAVWSAPAWAWLGGVLGVAFVFLNSRVVGSLGVTRTVALVSGAQIVAALAIDCISLGRPPTIIAVIGVVLIVCGLQLARDRVKTGTREISIASDLGR